MTEFLVTPTNIDLLGYVYRNPFTGKLTVPILTFNTTILNPFFSELDPLNNDPKYQKDVIKHFYMRLKEKWLYKDPVFRKLLKYFKVDIEGENGKISLIDDPGKISSTNVDEKYRNHIFKYIEKFFITKKFVEKILRKYVKVSHIKWYDLFSNTDTLKDLFAHKLKKLIIATIYDLQDKNKKE